MRQNILFGLSLLLAIGFASCEKAEFHTVAPPGPDDPIPTEIPMVKEESGDDWAGTHTYNSKGQITEEVYQDGFKYVYVYSPGALEITGYDSFGTVKSINWMKLNEKGLCIEQTISGNARTYYLEYDDQDRLIKDYAINQDGSKGNTFFYFYNEAGDHVKDSLSKPDGYWTVYKYEHYTDVLNTVGNTNFGKTYRGGSTKHCYKRRVMTSSVGELQIVDYLRPVQDEKGRVIERNLLYTNPNTGATSTSFYKYKYY